MVTSLESDPLLKPVPLVEGWKVLAPVVLYAKIGQGGMGAVYRGRHLDFDLDVAVKCLKPSLAAEDEQFIKRFRREARLAANLTHENLVRVYEYRRAHGIHYLVMEFIDGETSRERVTRKGALDEYEAAAIILGAARGLAKAHRNEEMIVHRDVKPDNIMISRRGEVKLADLGIAKAMEHDDGATFATQGVIGTPQYMAPEQWERDQAMGPQSDVWSFGATLYYFLTGENAIRAGSEKQVYVDICQKPFPDVRIKRPEVSLGMVAILNKCMQKDMTQRYADAGALADALSEFLGQKSPSLVDQETGAARTIPLVSPPPMPTMKRIRTQVDEATGTSSTPTPGGTIVVRRSSARWWWIGGALAAASLAVGLGIKYIPKQDEAPPVGTGDVTKPVLRMSFPREQEEVQGGEILKFSLDFNEDLGAARAEDQDGKIDGTTADFALLAPANDRLWRIKYEVEDRAGNLTKGTLTYMSKAKPKPPSPRIILTTPDSDDVIYLKELSIQIKGKVDHANEGKLTVSVNGEKEQALALGSNDQISIDQPIPPDKPSTIRLKYGDETKEIKVVQDSTEPSIIIESPANDALYTKEESIDIVARVIDTNLDAVLIEGSPMTKSKDGLYRADKAPLAFDGNHPFEIQAIDKVQRAPKKRLTVTRDQIRPSLTNASPAADSAVEEGSPVTVELTFNEALSSATIAGKSAQIVQDMSAKLSLTVPQGAGDWKVDYEVLDRAKNSTSRSLTYKRKAKTAAPQPVITLTGGLPPVGGKLYQQGTTLAIEGTIENPTDEQPEFTIDGKRVACQMAADGKLSVKPKFEADKVSKVELKYATALPIVFEVIQDSKDPVITMVTPDKDTYLTKDRTIELAVRVADDNLEKVEIGSLPMQFSEDSTWRAQIDLGKEGPNALVINATDKAKRSKARPFTITLDTAVPKLLATSSPKAGEQFAPGTKLSAKLVFDEPIAAVSIAAKEYPSTKDREVALEIDVPPGTGEWTLGGFVRDIAGNSSPFELKLGRKEPTAAPVGPSSNPSPPKPVDPTPNPTPAQPTGVVKNFPGLELSGTDRNSLGYSRAYKHTVTQIELIALDYSDSAKPTLYVSSGLVTEMQYRGKGDAKKPKVSVSANEVLSDWCATGRGKGLGLPTEAEWTRMSQSSIALIRDPPGLTAPLAELLQGSSKASEWPTRNSTGKAGKQKPINSLPLTGFRVVFRVP